MQTDTRHPEHESFLSLQSALSDLYARVSLGMQLGLERMRAACERHGHPEQALRTVHVAGTNGKGSVCAMLESIARAHGLRTGLYTSPHLCRFAERIRIDGEPIDDARLARVLTRVLASETDLSFFEVATLAAFIAFREARVDLAVIEVGIGGRLDATNVLPLPAAAAITRVAMDHADRLGPTLAHIAREKAGIAKPGLDIVLGPMSDPIRTTVDEVARACGATTSRPGPAALPRAIGLAGLHQRHNARVAAELGARTGASRAAIDRGLALARWPARLERIGPYLIDAAHNPDGARALARYVRALSFPPEQVALLFGTLADKEWRPMLKALAPLAATRIYVAPEGSARSAVDPHEMRALCPGTVAANLDDALATASAFVGAGRGVHDAAPLPEGGNGLGGADTAGRGTATHRIVIVAGSIVLVGDVRGRLCNLPRDPPVAL
ncbi:MAG: Mur ligase family protein [Polyangiaceae bacterium]|jgi:dihydrofolate synthase/folylpolyglutamate synthase